MHVPYNRENSRGEENFESVVTFLSILTIYIITY